MKLARNQEIETGVENAWRLFAWQGSVRLTAKNDAHGVTGGLIKSKEALYQAIVNLEKGEWNIYVGANPSRGSRIKAATREVEIWRYLVVDLDPLDPEVAPEQALQSVLRLLDTRLAGSFQSATIAFTGRGSQGWIALCPRVLSSHDERAAAERGMGTVLHTLKGAWGDSLGFRIDTSTSDLARIVRCPGTINWKTGQRARVISFGQPAVDSEHILAFAGPDLPEPEPLTNVSNLNAVAPHLNDRARQFLRMGVHEGERHKSAYAAAICLRELGVALDTTLLWVRRGGRKCYPKRLSSSECDHAVREAWKGR